MIGSIQEIFDSKKNKYFRISKLRRPVRTFVIYRHKFLMASSLGIELKD